MKRISLIFIFILVLFASQSLSSTYGVDKALSNENVNAYLNKDVAIYADGCYLEFYTSSKDRVYPITYNDSTYLPIRAISSLYNVPILWSGLENTIYLNDLGQVDTNAIEKVSSFNKEGLYNIEVIKNKRISLLYDSHRIDLYDVNGTMIYPLSYNDTTYLPVRAIANIFNRYVNYDGETNTVILSSKPNEEYITCNESGETYVSGDYQVEKDYSWIEYVNYRTDYEKNFIIDYYNCSGDALSSLFKFFDDRTEGGDNTKYEYYETNIDWGKPQSGDFYYNLAILNDTLCWSILLYKEDPVTGKNIYEDKVDEILDQISEAADGDELMQSLYVQYYNLQNHFPSYYTKSDEDYYFAVDDILIINGNESGDYKAKEIEISINDDYKKTFVLDKDKTIEVLDVDYKQYSILKCLDIKIRVLSTYNDDNVVCFTDFYPYQYSNIPQGI